MENPLEEAKLIQSIETNDKLEKISKDTEASLLIQSETNDSLKEVSKLLETRIEQSDIDTEKIIKALEKPEVQQVELKGVSIVTIKGDKGDKPTNEEITAIIEPLIPSESDLKAIIEPLIPKPIKGDDGKNYVLTNADKNKIASLIEVPIVEKIIEKTETIIEKPITIDKTKTVIKEVAKYENANEIADKLNTLSKKIDFKVIKNFPDFSKNGGSGLNTVFVDNITVFGNGLADNPLRSVGVGSSYTFSLPLSESSGVVSISQSDTSTDGYLSSTDWNTFNGKGDVFGPVSAVNSNFASFDTTTGKLIKDSGYKASDFASASSLANYLPLAGGTMVGNILFTDNTYDIGASGATRPRTLYIGTSAILDNPIGDTSTDGFVLANTTPATVGAQKFSPRIRLSGNGWKTTATAGSQTTDWILENSPTQGTTRPNNYLNFSAQTNGEGFTNLLSLGTNGANLPTERATFYFSNSGTRGLFLGGNMTITVGGSPTSTDGATMIDSGVKMRNSNIISWASSTNPTGSKDIGLARNAAGVLEINNGTAGNYRDLITRKQTITAGTLNSGASVLYVSATMSSSASTQTAITYDITPSGSASSTQIGTVTNLNTGYTGSGTTIASNFINSVSGTNTGGYDNGGTQSYVPLGNIGITTNAIGTTTGTNIGNVMRADGGNVNIGGWATSTLAKNSATNVGFAAFGLNTGTSPIQIGGYFGLETSSTSLPTWGTSAALIANNGSTTSDIVDFRDNGTSVFKVADNGNVVVGSAALATNATDGFLYIPTCAGTPTGTPTAFTGRVPMVWDSTNKKFYIYSGGAWLGGTVPGVFS